MATDSMKIKIQKKYLGIIKDSLDGQYRSVASQAIKDVVNMPSNDNDASSLENYLDQTLDFLDDLRAAINKFSAFTDEDNDKNWIFYDDRIWLDGLKLHIANNFFQEIQLGSLQDLISKYLSFEWSSPTIEWHLINAYLTHEIYIYGRAYVKHHSSLGRSVAIKLSSNELNYLALDLLLNPHLDRLIKGVLPSVFVTLLFINGWIYSAIFSGIFFFYFLIDKMTCLPKKLKSNRDFLRKYDSLIDIKDYTAYYSWSPRFLKQKIENINKEWTFSPELIPLLEKMAKRNADIFYIFPGLLKF